MMRMVNSNHQAGAPTFIHKSSLPRSNGMLANVRQKLENDARVQESIAVWRKTRTHLVQFHELANHDELRTIRVVIRSFLEEIIDGLKRVEDENAVP